jgi:hypothetical protein
MDLGSLLIITAVFLGAVLVLIRPFLVPGSRSTPVDPDYSSLLAEKERLLTALEDLEEEYSLQKLPEEDFQRKWKFLIHQTAIVLEELDQLSGSLPSLKGDMTAQYEGKEDQLEALIESRRQQLRNDQRRSCPHCGADIFPGDQFCGQCGECL